MFEVEQNFNLSEEQKTRLLDGATLLREKTFTDVYFDTPYFLLTGNDRWLRTRDKHFELKLPFDMEDEKIVDQYQEIENEDEIRTALSLPKIGSLVDLLQDHNILPFCTCTTTRNEYEKQGFTIDIDYVTYADCSLVYETCEIELLVPLREEMPDAAKHIAEFANRHGLTSEYIRGKVVEFLFRERQRHYSALLERGVVIDRS
jgi:adenylate cyclase class IV